MRLLCYGCLVALRAELVVLCLLMIVLRGKLIVLRGLVKPRDLAALLDKFKKTPDCSSALH